MEIRFPVCVGLTSPLDILPNRHKGVILLIGPVFSREVAITPRGWGHFIQRVLYVGALFGLILTAWLILLGSQNVRTLGDLSRFGSAVFALLAPLQLVMALAFAALLTTSAVAQEKDRRTLDLLLLTRMTNAELVLGKMLASSLSVFVLIVASVPLFMLLTLLGGIAYAQIGRVVAVTVAAAAVSSSLGSTLALWREKTFQSLALTAVLLVLWLIGGEVLASGQVSASWLGIPAETWAMVISPLRAVLAAMQPLADVQPALAWCGGPAWLFVLCALVLAAGLNLWAIARVRVWNPTRETRRQAAEDARETTAVVPKAQTSKEVWDNPVLWREIRTWAYGKKIIVVRLAYFAMFAVCAAVLVYQSNPNLTAENHLSLLPALAAPILPLMVLGLILINALAVTSLTNERDLRALDLLLVTDLTPKEIICGKLGGVFYNSKEMLLLPIALCLWLWWANLLSTENLVLVVLSFLVMTTFAAMLGLHCGMTYAVSQSAVGVSLGTVLFLLLGIGVCMRMMMAFQNSFTYQLQAFVAFMVCGGAGMFYALGIRNPSRAIALASGVTPLATYIVITNFFQRNFGAAFLVTAVAYCFATAAMLVPAVYEFDVATGRTIEQE